MLIYPEDKEFLRDSTMCYENIETGGDLFGLWKNGLMGHMPSHE